MEYIIEHDSPAQRFYTTVDGSEAHLDYQVAGYVMDIRHTFVPRPVEGRGIAAALVHTALEYARSRRWKVLPSCWYAELYLRRHPEYADLSV